MGRDAEVTTKGREVTQQSAVKTGGWRSALLELVLVLGLWVAYSGSRLFAANNVRPAQRRAAELLDIESALHLSVEGTINQVFVFSRGLSLFGAFWYATAHYI